MGGVGVHGIGAGPAGNGEGSKKCTLEKDIGSLSSDGGRQAAHDASNTNGATGVGNQQSIRLQGNGLAVEQGQLFTVQGSTYDNFTAEAVKVIGVHRLAQLKHHIVGDIHHGIDAADA